MAKKRPDPDPAPSPPSAAESAPMAVVANIVEALLPLAVPIAQLVPDPANARTHDDRNLDAIRGSLAAYGQRKPVVVNRRTNVPVRRITWGCVTGFGPGFSRAA